MGANIWNPNGLQPLPVTGHPKIQRFIATEGQTDFTLTNFSYVTGGGNLVVKLGSDQTTGVGFTELTTISFRLNEACEAGDVVIANGY